MVRVLVIVVVLMSSHVVIAVLMDPKNVMMGMQIIQMPV